MAAYGDSRLIDIDNIYVIIVRVVETQEYVDESGKSHFGNWFQRLDARAANKVLLAINRVETGNTSNVKSVGRGVHEIKIDFGPGYRVYFGRQGTELVILLAGGSKKRQSKDVQKLKTCGKSTGSARESRPPMPLTKKFRETVRERAQHDPEFRHGLIEESVQALMRGEVDVAKLFLRDYINATEGFDSFSERVGISKQSLMRMLSAKGNPRLDNFGSILASIRESESAEIEVSLVEREVVRESAMQRR